MGIDLFNYARLRTQVVNVGNVKIGGANSIRIQSMANTDTNDIDCSVKQCIAVSNVGCEIMRFTTQGMKEVENLNKIHYELRKQGYDVPLVADIHFRSEVAEIVATCVEKVRINPGNFVPSIKKVHDTSSYSEEEYKQEYKRLKERFASFLHICREHNTAIRIGVNHGSLSRRIMDRYGNTPQGMVESCLELLGICKEEDFDQVVISLKSSNTVLMVQAVRLLVDRMQECGFDYPLHLGVTEAGEGEDGRIKSAVGIGSLLLEGIGDTIRVSLSEDPVFEIPVAQLLISYISECANHPHIDCVESSEVNRYGYYKRSTNAVRNIGGNNPPAVLSSSFCSCSPLPEYYKEGESISDNEGNSYAIYSKDNYLLIETDKRDLKFLRLQLPELDNEVIHFLCENENIVVLLETSHKNGVGEQRAFFHTLLNVGCKAPVMICRKYQEDIVENLQVKSAVDFGALFIDGFGDGILIENMGNIDVESINSIAFCILQAARVRMTHVDYISCPGCGRTLYDLQTVVVQVKKATSHLNNLKIAVMGCCVNGLGEMADADYGYIGAVAGTVDLYRHQECIEKNVPAENAVEKLIEIINNDNLMLSES